MPISRETIGRPFLLRVLLRPTWAVAIGLSVLLTSGSAIPSWTAARSGRSSAVRHGNGQRFVSDHLIVGYRTAAYETDKRRARGRVHGSATASVGKDAET